MDRDIIRSVVKDQRDEIEAKFASKTIIERDGIEDARLLLAAPNALVVTGIRRCGKSIFSHLLCRGKPYGHVNFDDDRLGRVSIDDMDVVLDAVYQIHGNVDILILDEIQNIPSWELFVTRLQRTKRVIVTGSNAHLLAGDLATRLTGRFVQHVLYPYSFREYLRAVNFTLDQKATASVAMAKRHLEEYMAKGGIPDALVLGPSYLRDMFASIIARDIVSRNRPRFREELANLARYLVSAHGREITFNRLMSTSGLKDVHTTAKYVRNIQDAYLVFDVKRHTAKLREKARAPRKIYSIDNGIIHAVGYNESENRGRLMENAVAIELKRRCVVDHAMEIDYWKDHQQWEVDFIIRRGAKVDECMQVSSSIAQEETKDREMRSLRKAAQELGCRKLTVITWDNESDQDDVRFVPMWKWMLEIA